MSAIGCFARNVRMTISFLRAIFGYLVGFVRALAEKTVALGK